MAARLRLMLLLASVWAAHVAAAITPPPASIVTSERIEFESCEEESYVVFVRGRSRITAARTATGVSSDGVKEFTLGADDEQRGRRAPSGFYGALSREQLAALAAHGDVDTIACNRRISRHSPRAAARPRRTSKPAAACDTQNSFAPYNIQRLSERLPHYDGHFPYVATAGEGVDIYVFDTGVFVAHEDFGGRAHISELDLDDTGNSSSRRRHIERDGDDEDGHGTHVAGTAASKTYGVAKRAQVYSVKVLDDDGNGDFGRMLRGLEWVLAHMSREEAAAPPARRRRAVANFSLGGRRSEAVNAAFDHAVQVGGLAIVAAAGNDAGDACDATPGSAASVITVGATDESDELAYYSNVGGCVDILAPGSDVLSLAPSQATFMTLSGTSQAAPAVAGLAATVLGAVPELSASALAGVLAQHALPGAALMMNRDAATPNLVAHLDCTSFDARALRAEIAAGGGVNVLAAALGSAGAFVALLVAAAAVLFVAVSSRRGSSRSSPRASSSGHGVGRDVVTDDHGRCAPAAPHAAAATLEDVARTKSGDVL